MRSHQTLPLFLTSINALSKLQYDSGPDPPANVSPEYLASRITEGQVDLPCPSFGDGGCHHVYKEADVVQVRRMDLVLARARPKSAARGSGVRTSSLNCGSILIRAILYGMVARSRTRRYSTSSTNSRCSVRTTTTGTSPGD